MQLGKPITPDPRFIKLFLYLVSKRNGYHSISLPEDGRHLTTFIISWGHYYYKVAPQGYISSGNSYTHHFYEKVLALAKKQIEV